MEKLPKVSSSIEEYVGQDSFMYYMTPGFIPNIDTDTFLHVNRIPLEDVAETIRKEEAQGHLVNAAPLRLSTLHAVLSYKRAKLPEIPPEFNRKVAFMGELMQSLIKKGDQK